MICMDFYHVAFIIFKLLIDKLFGINFASTICPMINSFVPKIWTSFIYSVYTDFRFKDELYQLCI